MRPDPIITPDAPIETSEQDALGRTGFAFHLANALINLSTGPGIVVGLNGPWGSGKSSIKNLVLEHLAQEGNPLEVVEFNPWQYESASQLTKEFFEELAIACTSGIVDEADKRERRAKLWKYGSRIAKVGAAGAAAFLPVIGVALEKGTKELFDQIGKVMEDTGAGLAESVDKKSLKALKKELADELNDLEKPILVVVDDIDRLDKDELRLLFKLVKANADFPKVSYLLLFARERVELALSDQAEEGSKFLEKIVTVAFDVPALTTDDTLRIFHRTISPLVQQDQVATRLDVERWRMASETCIRHYLRSVRQVKRYAGMLRFQTSVFMQPEGLNVNFVDLAVLEILREFEPAVYRQLPHLGPALTEKSEMFLAAQGIDDDKRRALYTGIINDAKEEGRRPLVRACLAILFPGIDWATGDFFRLDEDELVGIGTLRLDRAAVFSRYFALDINVGEFSESSLKEIVSLTAHPPALLAKLNSLSVLSISELFQLLRARIDQIPIDNYSVVFEALYLRADQGPIFEHGLDGHPTDGFELLIALLRSASTDAQRESLYLGTAQRLDSFVMPICLLMVEFRRRIPIRASLWGKDAFIGDDLYIASRKWALGHLRDTAASGALLEHNALALLLVYWGSLADESEPQKWIESLAGDPNRVAKYLERVVAPFLPEDLATPGELRQSVMIYLSVLPALLGDLADLSRRDLSPRMRRAVNFSLQHARPKTAENQSEPETVDNTLKKRLPDLLGEEE